MVVSLQVLPPLVEKTIAIPCVPTFDFGSSCHAAIALVPCTATCGSTSAVLNLLPVSELSCDEQAAAYGDGPLMSTGGPAASAVLDVMSASALERAKIQTALPSNFTIPLCEH